jgi:hypothetical protein
MSLGDQIDRLKVVPSLDDLWLDVFAHNSWRIHSKHKVPLDFNQDLIQMFEPFSTLAQIPADQNLALIMHLRLKSKVLIISLLCNI